MPSIPIRQFLPSQAPQGAIQAGRPQSSAPDVSGLLRGAAQFDDNLEREQAQQRRLNEIADKAAADEQYLATKDLLADQYDEHANGILTGTVDKTSAQTKWAEKTRALIALSVDKVPPEQRQRVSAALSVDAQRFERLVSRTVEKRDRSDIAGAIDQTLEFAARMSETDPQGARHMVMQTLMEYGPFAGLTSQQVQAKANAWREEAAYTQGLRLLTTSKTNNAALTKVEQTIGGMGDLDPRRKVELLDRAANYKASNDQRAEIEANRRERAAERTLRIAEHEFNAFQALADKGGAIAPEYVDRVVAATSGTPYQAAVRGVAEVVRSNGGMALRPISEQRAALAAVDAQIAAAGRTPELDKRREQLAKVVSGSVEGAKVDPLAAYAERGGGTAPPVDLTSIDGLLQTLPNRVTYASTVEQWAGNHVSPLSSDEAHRIADQLRALPVEQRSAMVTRLAGAMAPRQSQALARQMDPKDRTTALALAAGSVIAPGERRILDADMPPRLVSELILRGGQRLADAKEPAPGSRGDQLRQGLRADIVDLLGDTLSGKARDDVIDAAILVNAGLESVGGRSGAKRSLEIALGGPLVEHNGRRIPVPAGIDNLAERLRTYPVGSIAAQAPDGFVYLPGGRPLGVPEFLGALPEAQLEPAGSGRYFVRSGGSLVQNQNSRPIVVDVR